CGYLEIDLSVMSGENRKREDITKIQLGSPDSPRAVAAREQRELETADGPIALHGKKRLVEDSGKLLHVDRLGLVDLDGLMQSKNAIYLIRKITNRFYYLPGGDENDLMQAARIGMAKAFRDYEPGHNSGFWTFAEMCVNRQVISEFIDANREKNAILTAASSLEAPATSPARSSTEDITLGEVVENPKSYDPIDVVAASETIKKIFHIVEGGLTEIERVSFICVNYMGFSYEETVEYMLYNLNDSSLDSKAVDNALQRVRRKIKQQVSID
ncbi:MAG: hypothetical protein Q7T74_05860, partial [Candidatus Saccharibacteria bacterium]|nr:hypothetical protein [Candidatus Saccharibacteria bacterium]